MYEEQTFSFPGFVVWFMCIKAFPAAPLAFVLSKDSAFNWVQTKICM